MGDLVRQLEGYRLTTAEILYRMPDHPSLLQSFLWQKYDVAPEFPKLQEFLAFWEREIEAKIHSVRVASTHIISPGEVRTVDREFTLH